VDINVTNVITLEAFEFNLTYDPDLLELESAPQIRVPFTSSSLGLNNGWVYITASGIPSINGTVTLTTITFKIRRYVTDAQQAWFVWNTNKSNYTCALAFSHHSLNGTGNTPIKHEVINGTYIYKPVPGDVDMSGKVDISDLAAVARAFGAKYNATDGKYWHDPPCTKCPHEPFLDIKVDEKKTINILDIVIVARNFLREEPEP
jgi:hypothetical protein